MGLPHWFSIMRLPGLPAVLWLYLVGADETVVVEVPWRPRPQLPSLSSPLGEGFRPPSWEPMTQRPCMSPGQPVLMVLHFLPKFPLFLGTLRMGRTVQQEQNMGK